MSNALFYGSGVALVTPFRGDDVDEAALERLIDWQIDSGTDALVILGTTGEPCTVTTSERGRIIECAVARAAGRVPVIVGAGSNDTRTATRLAAQARSLGADGVLAVTPYYNRPGRAGVIAHFRAVADAAELPVIMYNVPSRTGVNLEPEWVAELAKHPYLCAVKEASGNLNQLTGLAAACGDGVAIYSGNDDQVLPALALGARGVISVAANIIPALMHEMVDAWLRGEPERCRALQLESLPMIRVLFSQTNPIPVKAALAQMEKIENTLRLPLTPLEGEGLEALKKELRRWGIAG